MRAEIKAFWSPDIENLEAHRPEDPVNFGYFLQLLIGPADSRGEESFGLMVCTPRWLESEHSQHDIVVGRHNLFVFEYDFKRLLNYLKDLVSKVEGNTWTVLAEKLARIGDWEFEDYNASSGP